MRLILTLYILLLSISLALSIKLLDSTNLLADQTKITVGVQKYKTSNLKLSNLTSRQWMNQAFEIAKDENLSPPEAARFYSYTASVYSDVLEKTNNPYQASLATAEIIKTLYPKNKLETDKLLTTLSSTLTLTTVTIDILNEYKNRSQTDNFNLVWDKVIPAGEDRWYVRNNTMDKGVMAGKWETWILDENETFIVPDPPKPRTIKDLLEIEKVKYATDHWNNNKLDAIYFWQGSSLNATLSEAWQNILFTEAANSIDDKKYALVQKILAQTIADAFIYSWRVKYTYWTQRPSMRIPNLKLIVTDPPFPSYISDHSAISKAAASLLRLYFPEKAGLWEQIAQDAINSSFVAGINFNIDNEAGEDLGTQIADKILDKLGINHSKEKINTSRPASIKDIFEWATISFANLVYTDQIETTKIIDKYSALISKKSFEDITLKSGITANPSSGGGAWIDYDNDGPLDFFIDNHLYHNNGNGTFTDKTTVAGLDKLPRSGSTVFGDYDNDGCEDFYVSMHGFQTTLETPGQPDYLYHNNCDGTFTDVTKKSGIYDLYHGWGAAWADYNNDGFLDLYVANWGVTPGTIASPDNYKFEPNILYRNNGDGTFTDVTEQANVSGGAKCNNLNLNTGDKKKQKPAYQPIWFDYNNDQKPDLFVATDTLLSPLYRNNGDGTFTDVTEEAGLCKLGTGMGVTVGDYNNDGYLDLYVTNTGKNYLWRNNGNGTFTETAEESGVADDGQGWGTNFFDYNNDGYLDLFVANGTVDPYLEGDLKIKGNNLDELFENKGNGKFISITKKAGIFGNELKKGSVVGDYNGDGFLDLFIVLLDRPDNKINHFYENRGNQNNWLTIKLVGTKSNRDSVGARILVTVGHLSQIREVVAGNSFLSQDSLWQTFGLGVNRKVDSIEIIWPSGTKKILKNITSNQKLTVKEES